MGKSTITIKVEPDDSGTRLDIFLSGIRPQIASRSHIKKFIENGSILVDGLPVKAHHKVKAGESVMVNFTSDKNEGGPAPEDIKFDILYEDEHLLVVNKPAGIASHPSPGINSGTLVNALLYHCEKLSQGSSTGRPGIVHRLDKGTSGLMIVAKDDLAHDLLAKQFKERKVEKTYVAVVKGAVELERGKIELPIGRHQTQRQKQAVRFDRARDAVTEYKVLKRFPGATMLELKPKTGRMHQLRVHLSYIGHPILGDAIYGGKSVLIARQALHALGLKFTHPVTGKAMEFTSPLPEDINRLLEIL